MNGEVAQTVAVAAYGNKFLSSGLLDASKVTNATVFQYCNSVSFVELEKNKTGLNELLVAQGPIEWFKYLKNKGCRRLFLNYQHSDKPEEDRMLSAFVGGGGNLRIQCHYSDYMDSWLTKWELVKNKDKVSPRIWGVKYGLVEKNQPIAKPQLTELHELHNHLDKLLSDLEHFAIDNKLNGWGKTFKEAKDQLTSINPVNTLKYHPDIVPPEEFSLEKLQLISAACNAWVFGGMGSWNDLLMNTSRSNKQYTELSEDLYNSIFQCLLSVINN